MIEVNLRAQLVNANLQSSDLDYARLQGSILVNANLHDADLEYTDLQDADLTDVNLHDADLEYANLQDADLTDAKFDANTVLPDGTLWTPDTDIARFTNPEHPNFWRSDSPNSPAYGGDDTDN